MVVVVADVGAAADVADGAALWTVWVVLVLWCKVYDHGGNLQYIGVRFCEPDRWYCGAWVRFVNLMPHGSMQA